MNSKHLMSDFIWVTYFICFGLLRALTKEYSIRFRLKKLSAVNQYAEARQPSLKPAETLLNLNKRIPMKTDIFP